MLTSNLLAILMAVYIVGPLFLFILMLVLGLSLAKSLSNDPNRNMPTNFDRRNLDPETGRPKSDLPYAADRFGLFTTLENGKAKIIESSGQGFIDMIMNYPGHTFKGYTRDGKNLQPEVDEYWDVVPVKNGDQPLHPIGRWSIWSWKTLVFGTYRLAWWLWQKVLFEWKGWVFVGLDGFRQIRTYRLEYFHSEEDSEGKYILERRVSYSDHFRVQPFQFFVSIGSAETESLVAVKIILSQLMWVFNPYRAAYGTDNNWGSFLAARFASLVTAVVNKLPVEKTIALDAKETLFIGVQDRLLELVKVGKPLHNIGFMFDADGLTIPDRSTADPEAERKLAERAFATVTADARRILAAGTRDATITEAEGTAAATKKNAEAITAAGLGGLAAAQIEGQVRAVANAPQGAVVVVGGQTIDPAIAALLSKTTQKT